MTYTTKKLTRKQAVDFSLGLEIRVGAKHRIIDAGSGLLLITVLEINQAEYKICREIEAEL